MSSIGEFQLPGQAADAWINALIERQADSASHPELAAFGYINASAFSWNKDDLTSLPDIIESAQTCGAITVKWGLGNCRMGSSGTHGAPRLTRTNRQASKMLGLAPAFAASGEVCAKALYMGPFREPVVSRFGSS